MGFPRMLGRFHPMQTTGQVTAEQNLTCTREDRIRNECEQADQGGESRHGSNEVGEGRNVQPASQTVFGP